MKSEKANVRRKRGRAKSSEPNSNTEEQPVALGVQLSPLFVAVHEAQWLPRLRTGRFRFSIFTFSFVLLLACYVAALLFTPWLSMQCSRMASTIDTLKPRADVNTLFMHIGNTCGTPFFSLLACPTHALPTCRTPQSFSAHAPLDRSVGGCKSSQVGMLCNAG